MNAHDSAAYRTHVVHDALVHRQRGFVAQLDLMDRHACEVDDPACRLEIAAHRDRLTRLVEECEKNLLGCTGETDVADLVDAAGLDDAVDETDLAGAAS